MLGSIAGVGAMNKVRNNTGFEFLHAQVQTGITFAKLALDAGDNDKKERNIANALAAFQSIMRFRPDVILSDTEQQKLNRGVEELRRKLKQLGQHV